MSTKNGRIMLPDGMSYRVLALPNIKTMSLAAARKIRELVLAGAVVIGPKPERTTGRQDDAELKKITDELWDGGRVKPQAVKDALAALGVKPDVEGVADWIHRRDGEAEIYFICNQKPETASVAPIFRVNGRQPELWDPVTGVRRDAAVFTQVEGRTTIPLELPPNGSLFVVFQKPVTASGRGKNTPTFTRIGELGGAWQVTFDPKWGGPETVEFEKLVSWTDRPEPGIQAYSGTATYRKTFDLPSPTHHAPADHFFLDLGSIANLAEIRLNGKNLGVVWTPPFRVAISDVVKPTGNLLEIDVVNGWWNRILADESLPTERRLTQTNIRIKVSHKKDKPQPVVSGLLGPVTLLHAE
jgi:hypothetical protein